MTLLQRIAHYQTAVFYYILGGFTFLPLCALVFLIHFWLTAPKYHGERHTGAAASSEKVADLGEVIGEGELSDERKRQALDLAVWNREAEQEVKLHQSQHEALGSSTAPTSARRLNPARPPPRRPHRSGWLTVRRQFAIDGVKGALQKAAQQAAKQESVAQARSANVQANGDPAAAGKGQGYMSMMYRGMLNYRSGKGAAEGSGTRSRASGAAYESGSITPEGRQTGGDPYLSGTVTPPNQVSSAAQIAAATKETFFSILKGPILYLYSSADPSNPETECHAAIDLRNKRVSIYVADEGDTMGEPDAIHDASSPSDPSYDSSITNDAAPAQFSKKHKRARVRDGELFYKRNAVRIVSLGTQSERGRQGAKFAQWFVFAKSATQLEDWYHALVHASMFPPTPADKEIDIIGPVFSQDDMASLLSTLDSVPDPIPMRWLNAMVGRIFFSIYRTAWLEDYVSRKIRKKITRVRTPSFLSDIRVREVDLGRTPPIFSRPMLKTLTEDGEASMEMAVNYTGAIRLTISTVLTISLGQRFKQYTVSLLLAVIINSLEGNLLLQIKPPPSNRLWFGFTQLPKMDISVEPVVSERKVQWSMVKRMIEGRIKELLTESLVVPNMDDIPFFDSRHLDLRGGIWASAAKRHHYPDSHEDAAAQDQQNLSPPTVDKVEATSQSKSTPASLLNSPIGDEHGASSSIDVPSLNPEVRNRRAGVDPSLSESTLLSSSPAAAGLSTLLKRDQAMAAGSTRQAPNKRRSWFVGRQNTGNGGSALPAQRGNAPQSSLAWGSASMTRPPAASALSGEASSAPGHERNKESIASMISTGASETDTSMEAEQTDLESEGDASANALPLDGSIVDDEHGLPLLHVEPATLDEDQDVAETPNLSDGLEEMDGPVLTPTEDKPLAPSIPPRPVVNTSAQTFSPPPQRTNRAAVFPAAPASPASSIPDRQIPSPAAQSLASIQRERYGSRSHDDAAAQARAAHHPSTASLMSTWNKAKASMADRDSRQAAAKDARDALKRGWANWNSKRGSHHAGEEGGGYDSRMDGILTSSHQPSQRAESSNRSSRHSSWLASSPEDPASLGAGFEDQGMRHSPVGLFSNSDEREQEGSGSSSRATSTNGRVPYREHREARKKPGFDSTSRPSSRASSVRSVENLQAFHGEPSADVPSAPPISGLPTAATAASWSAEAPGLAAPIPAAHREDRAEAARPHQQTLTSSSPQSTIRRAMNAQAAVQNNKSDVSPSLKPSSPTPSYSFLPGQPTTTIGLSGIDLPTAPGKVSGTVDQQLPAQDKAEAPHQAQTNNDSPSQKSTPQFPATTKTSKNATGPPLLSDDPHTVAQVSNVHDESSPDREAAAANRSSSGHSPPQPGIKRQPARATMMAVPGIPSMQKAGPQSFAAPLPEPSTELLSSSLSSSKEQQSSSSMQQGAAGLASPRAAFTSFLSQRIPSFGGGGAGEPPASTIAAERNLELTSTPNSADAAGGPQVQQVEKVSSLKGDEIGVDVSKDDPLVQPSAAITSDQNADNSDAGLTTGIVSQQPIPTQMKRPVPAPPPPPRKPAEGGTRQASGGSIVINDALSEPETSGADKNEISVKDTDVEAAIDPTVPPTTQAFATLLPKVESEPHSAAAGKSDKVSSDSPPVDARTRSFGSQEDDHTDTK